MTRLTACAQGLDTATAVAFYAARDWAAWADSRQAWPEAAEAYRAGTAAMWRLLRVQVARPDQETWLRVTQTVPAGAGYAYARAGDPRMAVTAMEESRAILWTMSVTDLERLGPELAARYRQAAGALAPIIRSLRRKERRFLAVFLPAPRQVRQNADRGDSFRCLPSARPQRQTGSQR